MTRHRSGFAVVALGAALAVAACGGAKGSGTGVPESAKDADAPAQPERQSPPAPTDAKDMSLPPVHVAQLSNGLQVNTIVADQLPVVYATLVVRS
ncbi:MAG: hypothetical protein HKN10_15920, partial [Myxococcales bacterium]|nr:hypothetical protein [Myxococcales bacterium]